jgi:peptide chain release factor 1
MLYWLRSEARRVVLIRSCWWCGSSAYMHAWEHGGHFEIELLEERPGLLIFRASGTGATAAFRHEPGGHRVQRIPPTEKRGRVQTSTITVAVLREPEELEFYLNPNDVDIKVTRGSGPGGQARNKTESCVIATFKPTSLVVRIDTERSQAQNKRLALGLLRTKLLDQQQQQLSTQENAIRRTHVGSGMRGDKSVSVRFQDDQVVYHALGTRLRLKAYERGEWSFLDTESAGTEQ